LLTFAVTWRPLAAASNAGINVKARASNIHMYNNLLASIEALKTTGRTRKKI